MYRGPIKVSKKAQLRALYGGLPKRHLEPSRGHDIDKAWQPVFNHAFGAAR